MKNGEYVKLNSIGPGLAGQGCLSSIMLAEEGYIDQFLIVYNYPNSKDWFVVLPFGHELQIYEYDIAERCDMLPIKG